MEDSHRRYGVRAWIVVAGVLVLFSTAIQTPVAGARGRVDTAPTNLGHPLRSADPSTDPPDAVSGVVHSNPTPEGLEILVADADRVDLVAVLEVEGLETSLWTGYHCTTGTGRYVAAAFAPQEFLNSEDLRLRGAFLAVIDLEQRSVELVPERVALAYHSPGCGADDSVSAVRYLGEGGSRSELLRIEPSTGEVTERRTHDGHLTFPTPGTDLLYASAGDSLVAVKEGGIELLEREVGQVVDLHSGAEAVSYLVERDGRVRAKSDSSDPARESTELAEARTGEMRWAQGERGANRLVGAPDSTTPDQEVVDADTESELALDGKTASRLTGTASAPTGHGEVTVEATDLATGELSEVTLTTSQPVLKLGAVAASTARCAIPRNDPDVQVMQPSPEQVEWAAHHIAAGTLDLQRPANWNNNGLGTYDPLEQFPPVQLRGGGSIPPQVLLGVLAQESNLWQAARGALPGVAANPLIADYYGAVYSADGRIVDMDFDHADCGYGVGQITDGMEAGSASLSADQQMMVATDYVANIAAAAQILASKWNQAHDQNLIIGFGDPEKVTSWYFAIWGYNSGIYPESQNPHGVGWTNNPANSDWRFDRDYFLRDDLDDARHPGDWPYQERVLGFAETGLYLYGERAFQPVQGSLNSLPTVDGAVDRFVFCSMERNECDPSYVDPASGSSAVRYDRSFCTRADRKCYWSGQSLAISPVATGFAIGAPVSEPAGDNPHPPSCSPAESDIGGGSPDVLPANLSVVDDLAVSKNLVGCAEQASRGTFRFEYGNGAEPAPLAQIDTHQIGAGYGGHFWYAHTVDPARESHLVTGIWTPPQYATGWQRVLVHIPDHGADTNQADYRIWTGTKEYHRTVNQRWNQNVWVDLGVFNLGPGATVSLSNGTWDDFDRQVPDVDDPDSTHRREIDIAWDAIAFVPAGKPAVSYVAFGDSYSAGEGIEPYWPDSDNGAKTPGFRNKCHRSKTGFPEQVFDELAARQPGGTKVFKNATCSGAVTADLVGDGSTHGEVPQIAAGWLDENTTHVSVSIGGNDVGFSEVLTDCYVGFTDCDSSSNLVEDGSGAQRPLSEVLPERIFDVQARLEATLLEIRREAPNAEIALVGYPQVLGRRWEGPYPTDPPTWVDCDINLPGAQIRDSEAEFIEEMGDLMAYVMEVAAARQRSLFVDPRDAFAIHGACSRGEPPDSGVPVLWDRWIHQIIFESDSGSGVNRVGAGSFHPKQEGADAYAELVSNAFPTAPPPSGGGK